MPGGLRAEAAQLLKAEHPDKAELIDAYYARFDEMIAGPIEGTVAILAELRARGTPLYFLSNYSAETYPLALARFDFCRLVRRRHRLGRARDHQARPRDLRAADRAASASTRTARSLSTTSPPMPRRRAPSAFSKPHAHPLGFPELARYSTLRAERASTAASLALGLAGGDKRRAYLSARISRCGGCGPIRRAARRRCCACGIAPDAVRRFVDFAAPAREPLAVEGQDADHPGYCARGCRRCRRAST
jgi:hypothetical protein